jgi:hypothetical protein
VKFSEIAIDTFYVRISGKSTEHLTHKIGIDMTVLLGYNRSNG